VRIVITPHRDAVEVKPGERLPTEEENRAAIAAGRAKMARDLLRRFPQARIVGIVGESELLVDLPDSEPDLPSRIRASLRVETGPDPGAKPTGPVWYDAAPTQGDVDQAHADKAYRPTVVALVRDGRGRLLLVQSRFNPDEWMFVQGGIEEGEAPLEALARELREEIDVGADFFAPSAYVGTADLDAEEGRVDKRGFTKGKRYYIYEVAYRGPEELRLQAEELSGYSWVEARFDDPRLLAMLRTTRKAKRELIIGALIRVLAWRDRSPTGVP